MYLKALEINGFKSFANKTIIEFDSGITSIVGPNGSGKSNILDAILWVLGEQSYKNIRAKESSDVIFSGGKNKKAKNQAEVSLYINNDDKYLDIDFTDVKITRKIFKSGENQYFLNNERIRLKDIHNLFLDTGIGKQAYSVIGQGRVERIIGSSPKELREIIEEAAGVKKAKNEKEEATKKLENVKNEIEKIDYVEKSLSKDETIASIIIFIIFLTGFSVYKIKDYLDLATNLILIIITFILKRKSEKKFFRVAFLFVAIFSLLIYLKQNTIFNKFF